MPVALPWNRDAAHQAFKTMGLTATGLLFIAANQPGAQAPPLPYGTFLVTGGPTPLYGMGPEVSTFDAGAPAGEENTLHAGGQARLSVSFQTFARTGGAEDSAISYLDRLGAYLQTSSAKTVMDTPALALTRPPTPTDISAAVGAEMQSRASMDVDFNAYLDISIDAVEYVLTTDITADTLDDVDGTVVSNETITVTGV